MQVMANLKAVLEAAGGSFDNVVKTTVLLADMGDFAAVNEVYGLLLQPVSTMYIAQLQLQNSGLGSTEFCTSTTKKEVQNGFENRKENVLLNLVDILVLMIEGTACL